ncbi:MAG: CPBP family intramembrane metalloprotease [Bacteroidales bacterium]|jgi:membrane protease YdiL (CAAX protease family)|nr:CPBP family intramembrane metalloprotease [Bacteroidales bacterium]
MAQKRYLLYAELGILYLLAPVIYALGWVQGPKFLALLVGLIYVILVILANKKLPHTVFKLRFHGFLQTMITRFLVVALGLTFYMLHFEPENFLILPRTQTWLWLAIMVFYPIFSALPQEIIYRLFFIQRYKTLFANEKLLWIMNALLFGLAHLLFHNPIAVLGGVLMGIFWYQTYVRTGSLWAVTLEHALYGNFIYTIGFGHYFYVPDF